MNTTQLKALEHLKEKEAHYTRCLESARNQAATVQSMDFTDARIRAIQLVAYTRGQFGLNGPDDFDWYGTNSLPKVNETYIDVDASDPEAFAEYASLSCGGYSPDWVAPTVDVVINNRDGNVRYCYKVMPYVGEEDYAFDLVRLPYTNFIATERQCDAD